MSDEVQSPDVNQNERAAKVVHQLFKKHMKEKTKEWNSILEREEEEEGKSVSDYRDRELLQSPESQKGIDTKLPGVSVKPQRPSMRVAESTTRGSFTLGSTNKRKSASAVSEEVPMADNLITVKEEPEEQGVPMHNSKQEEEEESSEEDEPEAPPPPPPEKMPTESKISKTLSDRTTRTVIIIIPEFC